MLKLVHPFTMIICGPSQSGKTSFAFRMLNDADRMIDRPPTKVLYCYNRYRPDPDQSMTNNVQFHRGLPSADMFDGLYPALVVLDDLMTEMDKSVAELFTVVSHHADLSVVFVAHNLFPKNPHARTVSLNAHYVVLFKNVRDGAQFQVMARQMYGGNYRSKFAVEAMDDATRPPHGYLLLDLKPATDDRFRLRTGVFPDDQCYVYVDRCLYKPEGWGENNSMGLMQRLI
jgi:hypothetical protein